MTAIRDGKKGRPNSSVVRSTGAAAIAFALAWGMATPARADVGDFNVGAFAGVHLFAQDNELGVYLNSPPDRAPQHMALVGFRLGWMPWERFGFEGEVGIIPTWTRGGDKGFEGILTYRGAARFNLLTGWVRPFVLAGGGAHTMVNVPDDRFVYRDTDPYVQVGIGSEFDITEHWGIRGDARLLVVPAVGQPDSTLDYEILIGFYRRWHKPANTDKDNDGIPDAEDKCPEVVGIKDLGGCPDVDNDADGLLDKQDKCPLVPGPKENEGCPDKDGDNDGVVDRLDKCPAEVGPKENDGCPDKDSDSDGVFDRLDKCPAQAGAKENDGCPFVDSDGDGIPDGMDKCPDKAENKNNYQDDDGCPEELPQQVAKFTGIIKGIHFAVNDDEILNDSYALLDEAVQMLKDYPEIKIEIGGHTDSSGSLDHNKSLSQDRANKVRDYFLKRGVEASRITAVGYGPDKPIAPNSTKEGRASNRRVEFVLVK